MAMLIYRKSTLTIYIPIQISSKYGGWGDRGWG